MFRITRRAALKVFLASTGVLAAKVLPIFPEIGLASNNARQKPPTGTVWADLDFVQGSGAELSPTDVKQYVSSHPGIRALTKAKGVTGRELTSTRAFKHQIRTGNSLVVSVTEVANNQVLMTGRLATPIKGHETFADVWEMQDKSLRLNALVRDDRQVHIRPTGPKLSAIGATEAEACQWWENQCWTCCQVSWSCVIGGCIACAAVACATTGIGCIICLAAVCPWVSIGACCTDWRFHCNGCGCY